MPRALLMLSCALWSALVGTSASDNTTSRGFLAAQTKWRVLLPEVSAVTSEQVLVFDAGSSGTRIHIFNLHHPLEVAHVPEIDSSVREKQTLKLKPGLSHYALNNDVDGAQQSIEKLVEFANKFVDQTMRRHTPAVLKATAGLRATPEKQAEAVLLRVRRTLAASGYMFQEDWAGIIRGREEAGLAWVAANYLRGTFKNPGSVNSLGIIEMGGGSTQVCFQVGDTENLVEDDHFVFTTALGKSYNLYAHSYLGYGLDYAQKKMLELSDPDDDCYPVGYERSSPSHARGVGNAKSCQHRIQSGLFDSNSAAAPGHYEHEKRLQGDFAATENFFWVSSRSGGLPSDEKNMKMGQLAEHLGQVADRVCGSQLKAGGADDPTQPNECFGLSYQVVFMKALPLPPTTNVNVQVLHQIGGSDLDWAVGAALMVSLEVAANRVAPQKQRGGFVWFAPSVAIIVLLTISATVLGCIFYRKKKGKAVHFPSNGHARDSTSTKIGFPAE